MLNRRRLKLQVVTPTVDTSAYGTGDVISTVQELTNAVAEAGGIAELRSLVVSDESNQKSAIDLVFFDENPVNSIGADNAAYALNDADAPKVVGRITVAAADYVSSSTTSAEATLKNIGLLLKAKAASKSVWMAIISRGSPTYGAAGDLIVKLGLDQS